MFSREELQRMMETDVKTVDPDTLTDLKDIVIDTEKSVPEKLEQFAAQTNNLFVHRLGDYVVKVTYADTGATINQRMQEYIERLAEQQL